jgi:hypothetical protein
VRLAGIGLLAAAVTGALYAAGRLHTPNYTFSLFGQTGLAAVTLKSLLASVVLGLAPLHVPLAPVDLPQTAAGRQPAAAGPPHPPDHRLRPVRAVRNHAQTTARVEDQLDGSATGRGHGLSEAALSLRKAAPNSQPSEGVHRCPITRGGLRRSTQHPV